MKQPEDTRTIELAIDAKRGRGRPALASALSQAERARRYRAKRKSEGVKSDVTENERPLQDTWRTMVLHLETENAELQAKSTAKKFAFDEFLRIEQENVRLKRLVELAEKERNAAFKAHAELEKKIKETQIKSNIASPLGQDLGALKLALAHCLHARSQKKRITDKLAEAYSKLTK